MCHHPIVGLAPAECKIGDVLCYLRGTKWFTILRSLGNSKWTLISGICKSLDRYYNPEVGETNVEGIAEDLADDLDVEETTFEIV